ncbi:MAG: hypothetical protein RJA07_362 [Bacteroidota bacterium]
MGEMKDVPLDQYRGIKKEKGGVFCTILNPFNRHLREPKHRYSDNRNHTRMGVTASTGSVFLKFSQDFVKQALVEQHSF